MSVNDEKHTDRINIRIRPTIKAAAEIAAKSQGRTLSNYIEELIKKDTRRS